MNIRLETADDYRQVEELTRDAFWNFYVPGCAEHLVIHNLRKSPDFISELDFVAVENGEIIGHIAYTNGRIIKDDGVEIVALCIGPLSVRPDMWKRGVGSILMKQSLEKARLLGYKAALLTGDPRYYSRFGFRCAEKYDIKNSLGKYSVALMALELQKDALKDSGGQFVESDAFGLDEKELEEFDKTFPYKEKAETETQKIFQVLASIYY